MSTKRKGKMPYREKGRCSWCGTFDLPKNRRSWCSDKCVDAYRMISDPGFVRSKVHERDQGICSGCGLDCDELAKEFNRFKSRRRSYFSWQTIGHERTRKMIARWGPKGAPNVYARYVQAINRRYKEMSKDLTAQGFDTQRTTFWDADHIVPVVEGGGECGLDNYRTLCQPCHKAETKALAARRAKARREEIQPELDL